MSSFAVHNVSLRGVSACVPVRREDNMELDLIPESQREIFIQTTGIRYRRMAAPGTTAADLCRVSAQKLMSDLGWQPDEIGVLVLITQTPDYVVPNSSSIIQHQLGIPKDCLALDINLGCSGYVYGLSVIGSLLQNMPGRKGLLLVGDCSSAIVSKGDKATYPLFSDAGSATAIEHQAGTSWHFDLHTDGSGYEDIIVKGGGMKHPFHMHSLDPVDHGPGEVRSDLQMKLDGLNIFNFALREVASNIESVMASAQVSAGDTDYYVLHQANKLILECVRKKLKAPSEKFPYSLYDYGNTSSASIPVTIASQLHGSLPESRKNLVLSGFGVGLSWGAAVIDFSQAHIADIIEI
ncbi:MAG: ketoacyl-ACP synthase III [Bacteroidetes bacterium]|nr:ketoacyl-ACP synthase III [Bacteroidota bacterium]